MEHHPLLKELQEICVAHKLDAARALTTFESYIELSEGEKLHDLEYGFSEALQMFYLLGKKEKTDKNLDVYVPVMLQDDLSPQDMDNWHKLLCSDHKKLHILIRDRDSSSTCYQITKGLVKPYTSSETQEKKDKEFNNYQLEKIIHNNRIKLYMKALKEKK